MELRAEEWFWYGEVWLISDEGRYFSKFVIDAERMGWLSVRTITRYRFGAGEQGVQEGDGVSRISDSALRYW